MSTTNSPKHHKRSLAAYTRAVHSTCPNCHRMNAYFKVYDPSLTLGFYRYCRYCHYYHIPGKDN